MRAAGTRWDLALANDNVRFDLQPATDNPRLTSVVGAVQAGTYRKGTGALSVSYGPQSVYTCTKRSKCCANTRYSTLRSGCRGR